MESGARVKVGSLFSGIGGIDLGLERAGMEVVWQCEIDPYRRRVLEKLWPNAVRYEDVRSIGSDGFYHESYRLGNGREGQYVAPRLDSVDLICGGFPCQDLSVAGRRAGLSGSRSGLFYEFARIVGEVRPEWLLVENVPGLLSSNGGDDFRIVIDTFQGFGYGLSWRILDSRYFGVAQRRRRVYIVGSLGDLRSAAVLFEPQSGGGDSQAGRETGQEVAAPLGASTSSYSGRRNDLDHEPYIPEVTGSLDSTLDHHGWSIPNQSFDQNFLQVVALQGAGATSQGSQGSGWKENESFTLNKTDVHGVAIASTVRRLTPTECERLQAFPDGWTDLGGTKDGPRYAACGDAVTSTVAEWIGRRLVMSRGPAPAPEEGTARSVPEGVARVLEGRGRILEGSDRIPEGLGRSTISERNSDMPIARSLDHMNMILERFAQREDRHLMFQHIQEFQEAGHLDDNCEYCLGMLRLVGGATGDELDHIRHVSKEIRERVRAAIVDGVKARCSVRFITMPTDDSEETVTAELLPMPPLNLDTMVITFNVPARKKITFNVPAAWCQ